MNRRYGTALVTGASSGIGRAVARRLAPGCDRLLLVARRRRELETAAAEAHAAGCAEVEVVAADLADPAALEVLATRVETGGEGGPPLDLLVNNAGLGHARHFAETAPEDLARMVAVNMVAPTRLARAALPGMLARGRGAVLNVASVAAFQPGPGMAVYFATKAYLLSLSRALAEEAAGGGVTVTALCPGPTWTELPALSRLGGTRLFRAPFPVADADSVARAGLDAVRRGRRVAVTGVANRLFTSAPEAARTWLIQRLVAT